MGKDNFTDGWKNILQKWAPLARVFSAVFKLTELGKKPVPLKELAAAVGSSPGDTTELLTQFFGGEVRVQNGLVHLAMMETRQPSSRFELRIGNRRLYPGGCVPDQFWIAYFSNV